MTATISVSDALAVCVATHDARDAAEADMKIADNAVYEAAFAVYDAIDDNARDTARDVTNAASDAYEVSRANLGATQIAHDEACDVLRAVTATRELQS